MVKVPGTQFFWMFVQGFFHFIIGIRTKTQAENSQTCFGNSNSKDYAN